MDFIYTIFGTPLGYIMWVCYLLTKDIGLAIIIFTLIVKVASFPLSLKQQKNTAQSQLFAPRVKEIQAKYRNNQQKMQEETSKLQKEGYNPAGGCLPMILTLVILFGVLDVVYKPMTHFERFESVEAGSIAAVKEISLEHEYAEYLKENEEATDNEKSKFRSTLETNYKSLQGELRVIGIYKSNPEAFSGINGEILKRMDILEERIVFLGIDFSERPTLIFAPIIIIPILCFLFSIAQTIITQYIQKKTMPDLGQQMVAMKYMLYAMPLFSLYIVFQFPAGVGFYWTISSVIGIAQSVLIYKIWPPEKMREQAKAALERKNKGISFDTEVVIEKETKDGEVEVKTKKKSEMSSNERKDYYRKKLEEARRADLEKYGEVGKPLPTSSDDTQE
ncbi:MAG: YidC/Oxa1 family membrane protein insertase [Oscillospiraceae bacterium]|nr:YidC/Oxa1 family membrane protein insertase [Oscillospiraceae bacterium]